MNLARRLDVLLSEAKITQIDLQTLSGFDGLAQLATYAIECRWKTQEVKSNLGNSAGWFKTHPIQTDTGNAAKPGPVFLPIWLGGVDSREAMLGLRALYARWDGTDSIRPPISNMSWVLAQANLRHLDCWIVIGIKFDDVRGSHTLELGELKYEVLGSGLEDDENEAEPAERSHSTFYNELSDKLKINLEG